MCRFVLYQGPPILLDSLLTQPKNSLIHQSSHSLEREEPLNGDGFGLCWYAPEVSQVPARFRSITPAWNNLNLIELARVVKSPLVLAHVRAATQVRAVSEANCHPFTFGPLAFMHNGDVGGFHHLRRTLLGRLSDAYFNALGGTTDSEHAFALVLERLGKDPYEAASADLVSAMKAMIGELLELGRHYAPEEPSYFNMALTNGRCSVITRFTTDESYDGESLHFHRGVRYVCEGGLCRMLSPDQGGQAVIVSSEVLSEDPGWEMVPRNHMLVIDEERAVTAQAI